MSRRSGSCGAFAHERSFSFDALNRLSGMSGLLSAVTWDPVGRMASVLHGGTAVDYQDDSGMLVAEYVGATRFRRHIHGPGVDEPVVVYESSGVASWPLADHLGSFVGYADSAGALS